MIQGYDLPPDAPGAYLSIRSDKEVPFSKFYKPDQLPPELTLSGETIKQIERAMHALGRLDGFRGQIPEAETVLQPLIYKEAEQSSQIEGTQVTTTDIYRMTSGGDSTTRTRDVQEAQNYVAALQTAADSLLERGRSRSNLTKELLLDLHKTIMDSGYTDEEDPLPGQLRPDYAWIEESSAPWKKSIRFVPPKAGMVAGLIDDFISFIQGETTYSAIVDIAIAHYQFETIHPFKDGNGRVGRLLILLMLVASDTLSSPLFYMSAYIKANREEYTDRLLAVSEQGEWEEWIQFFVTGMQDQAEEVLGRAKLLQDLAVKYGNEYDSEATSVRRLIRVLFEQPYITVPTAAERIDMAYPTANTAVTRLVDDGVLIQVGDKERNREFVATEIMDAVECDPENLPSPASVLQ